MDMRATVSTDFEDLVTLRDVLRYAVSRYQEAGLHFGHGATRAVDEAAFLILESLHLPPDDFNAFADARLARREKALLAERIARRVEERIPAAYLTGRTYLNGFSFRSDARAIVPRSYIAELLFSPLFNGAGEEGALVLDPFEVQRVLDLCTGGGSLAIIAAHAFPNAIIDAVELSPEAASLAAENIAARRTRETGTSAASAMASRSSASNAPWRTSPEMRPRSSCCSGAVAAANNARTSRTLSSCDPGPDSHAIRSSAASTAAAVSVASAAGAGRSASVRQPTPVRRWRSWPER